MPRRWHSTSRREPFDLATVSTIEVANAVKLSGSESLQLFEASSIKLASALAFLSTWSTASESTELR